MFCPKCGWELPDGSNFCTYCGAEILPDVKKAALKEREKAEIPSWINEDPQKDRQEDGSIVSAEGVVPADDSGITNQGPGPLLQGEWVTDHILRCNDGVYRWIYELNLYKNPTVFTLVWKIFFFILTGMFALLIAVDLFRWGFDQSALLTNLKVYGYVLLGMTVLVGISYLIYGAMMGGKYCVLFEMDENGINHKQMPKQAQKAKLLSELTVLAGLASGNLTTFGAGMAAARTEMYTEFKRAKKMKSYPRRGLIKLSETLDHNQIYTEKEDFEFVNNYISERCTNLKKKK